MKKTKTTKRTTTKTRTTTNFGLETNKGRGTVDKLQAEIAGKVSKALRKNTAFANIEVVITGKWVRLLVSQKTINSMSAINRRRFAAILNNKTHHLHTVNSKGENVTHKWEYIKSNGYFKCGPRIGFTPNAGAGRRYGGSTFKVV